MNIEAQFVSVAMVSAFACAIVSFTGLAQWLELRETKRRLRLAEARIKVFVHTCLHASIDGQAIRDLATETDAVLNPRKYADFFAIQARFDYEKAQWR